MLIIIELTNAKIERMKNKKNILIVARIVGIIVTLLLLLAFVPKLVGSIKEEGLAYLLEIPKAFVDWYDNPIAFFFTYFIGYAIIWWKPLVGSLIIIVGDILFFAFNISNIGTLIFILPTLIVALLYILYWDSARKENINETHQ